jgi:hypothetical protein
LHFYACVGFATSDYVQDGRAQHMYTNNPIYVYYKPHICVFIKPHNTITCVCCVCTPIYTQAAHARYERACIHKPRHMRILTSMQAIYALIHCTCVYTCAHTHIITNTHTCTQARDALALPSTPNSFPSPKWAFSNTTSRSGCTSTCTR